MKIIPQASNAIIVETRQGVCYTILDADELGLSITPSKPGWLEIPRVGELGAGYIRKIDRIVLKTLMEVE